MANKTETILDVEGMTCGSCVRHVVAALSTVDGVGAVQVNLRDGQVRVEHDPSRAHIEQMLHALDEAGYGARASQ